MTRTVPFIQIVGGTILFMIVLLALVSKDFKQDMKLFMYFIMIVTVAVVIQAVLFYDEQSDLYVNTKTGEFVIEENI